jgi:putative NADPH-quinone reductase
VNVLVIHAHPCGESFSSYLLGRVLAGLDEGSHQTRLVRLTAEPADGGDDLDWAEAVVWVYPTWWSGTPAVLKDWIDRNWPLRALSNIRSMAVVTTHGSSWWVNRFEGQNGKRLILGVLSDTCHQRCRRRWIALYGTDRSSPAGRRSFADRVHREMPSIK